MVESLVAGGVGVVDRLIAIECFLGDDEGVDEFVVAPAGWGGVELVGTEEEGEEEQPQKR